MTHTFDTSAQFDSSASPATTTYTCGASCTVLVVGIVTKRGGGTSARAGGAPTYNSVTMTQADITRNATETDCELWYLIDPDTGSAHTLSVPNTGTEQLHVHISSYNSSTGTSAFDVASGSTGTIAVASTSVTPTVDGAAIVDICGTGHKNAPTGNQTGLFNVDAGNYSHNSQYALQGTAGAITFSWTQDGGDDWCIVAAAFKEVSASANLEVPAANLQLSTTAPSKVIDYRRDPPASNLQFSTAAPSLSFGYNLSPPAANLQWSTAAPTVEIAAFAPDFDKFRFYNDGTESGATPKAAEDVNIFLASVGDAEFHLRGRVQETGGVPGAVTDDWNVQYSKNSGAWVTVTNSTSNVTFDTTSGLIDGGAVTQRLTAGTGSFISGRQEEDTGPILNVQLTASNHLEHVFAMKLIDADLAGGDTLDFRFTLNAGAPGMANTAIPRITVSISISPPAANLQFSTTAPSKVLDYRIEPPGANLQLSTTAPTVQQGFSIEIPAANLQWSTTAPVLDVTNNVSIEIPAANLFLAGGVDLYAASNTNSFYEIAATVLDSEYGQSFTGDGGFLARASFNLRKAGTPVGNITANLYAHSGTFGVNGVPTGASLATSDAVSIVPLGTAAEIVHFDFDGTVLLENGVNYFIALSLSDGDSSNRLEIARDTSAPSHGGNAAAFFASWTPDSTSDAIFYIYAIRSLSVGFGLSPPAAQLQWSTSTPTVNQGFSIEIPAAQLEISTSIPALLLDTRREPPAAQLEWSTFTPTVDVPSAIEIEIPAAQLQFSTTAPSLVQNVNRIPPAANLEISTTAPVLTQDHRFEPPAAQLVWSTSVPNVLVPSDVSLEIPAANLEFSTSPPVVDVTGQIVPSLGNLGEVPTDLKRRRKKFINKRDRLRKEIAALFESPSAAPRRPKPVAPASPSVSPSRTGEAERLSAALAAAEGELQEVEAEINRVMLMKEEEEMIAILLLTA